MPEVKHPIYPGSSSGDLVGPINLENHSERLWQLTEDDKKKFYGSYRVAVGGSTDTASQESAKRTQFKKAELQRPPAEGDACLSLLLTMACRLIFTGTSSQFGRPGQS